MSLDKSSTVLPFPADPNSQEVASPQPQQQPTTSATAATVSDLSMGAVPVSDTPQPVAGPSTERPTNRVDSGLLRQLVHFADAGIEDLGSFLGLVANFALHLFIALLIENIHTSGIFCIIEGWEI